MQKAQKRSLARSIGVLMALVVLASACSSNDSESTTTAAGPADTTTTTAGQAETTTTAAATTTTPAEPLKIAYIQTGSFDYYERGVEGARLAAEALGVELIVMNSELDAEKEIANVEDAIVQGVDGILLFSVGRASEEAALKKAADAGVLAAVLYGYAPELEDLGAVFVQVDTAASGTMIGAWLAEELDAGKVAVIQGALGRGDAEAYTDSFKEALSANPGLEVVAEPSANWSRADAVAVMEDILTAFPDLSAVFVHNEDMALGAIQAINTAGKSDQIVVVSQNGSPDGLVAVNEGAIGATAGWSPSFEAQIAFSRLVTALVSGSAPEPKLCHTPITLITVLNVGDADPWIPTIESTQRALTAQCG